MNANNSYPKTKGQRDGLRLSALAYAALLVVGGVSETAAAQSAEGQANKPAETNSLETVVVSGLRASLEKSLNVKKFAVGVVDAISAEDIGKFPDANIAEAMMRIPGISVSRGTVSQSSTSQGSSSGDANQITVRGFGPTFNTTLYDGRVAATSTGDRGFNFGAVGADFVGQVDVMKTPDPTLASGAIGATINVKYPKPFDKNGMRAAFTASGSMQDQSKSAAPSVGALFSNTFADNTIGILVDGMYSSRKSINNHVNIQGWSTTTLAPSQFAGAAPGASTTPGTTNYWLPQDIGIIQEESETKRFDGRAVVQWKPAANVTVTVNDNYSRSHFSQYANGFSAWFWGFNDVKLSPNNTIISNVQNFSGTDFQSQHNQSMVVSNETGANVKWDFNERLSFELDAAKSNSKLNPNGTNSAFIADVGYGGPNSTSLGVTGFASGAVPYITGYGPAGNASQFGNPAILGSHVVIIQSMRNAADVDQLKLQGAWKGDSLNVKFGVQHVNDKKKMAVFGDQLNGLQNAYAGYGPASGSTTGVALPTNLFNGSFSTANFIPGFSNVGKLPATIPSFDPYAVVNYLQGLGDPQAKNIPGFNYGSVYSRPFNGQFLSDEYLSSRRSISETTNSAFVNAAIEEEIANMPLSINLGLRTESTRIKADGLGSPPVTLTVVPGDPSAYAATFPATPTLVSASNKYQYWLPSLDLNLMVTDNVKLRFDISRSLTRPPVSDLSPVLSNFVTRVNGLQATGGNPNLKPYLANNIDVGAEWYYAKNSYLAIGQFMKKVSNFVVGGTVQQPVNGVVLPGTSTPAIFNVTSQVNGPSATIHGTEIALQHVFGNSGYGLQANATFVGTNKPYNPNDLSQSGFAVTGIGNSANLVAFYDKNGFQARFALNWRGEYLDHFGQLNAYSAYGAEPTFINANKQLDFSTSYDINSNMSIFGTATNLNNSTFSTHGRFKEQFLDAVRIGRRYTIGARYKF